MAGETNRVTRSRFRSPDSTLRRSGRRRASPGLRRALPDEFRATLRAVSAVLFVILAPCATAQDSVDRCFGYAYDAATDELLYREQHDRYYQDAEVVFERVLYLDASGRLLAAKDLDFQRDLFAPEYRLRDARSTYEEGARQRGGLIEAYYRADAERPEQSRRLPAEGPVVVDAGIEQFILANWQALKDGDSLDIKLLMAVQLEFVDFAVAKVAESDLDGVPAITFRVAPTNVLLRALMTPMRFTFSSQSRLLLVYEGAAPIKDRRGLKTAIRVVYPASERNSGSVPAPPDAEPGLEGGI